MAKRYNPYRERRTLMATICIIISLLALTSSHLCLLIECKRLKKKVENSEARYLELAAWALRRKENGQEE